MFMKSGQPLPRSYGCHGLTLNSIVYSLHQIREHFPAEHRPRDTRDVRLCYARGLRGCGLFILTPSFLKFCGWRCCVINGVVSIQEHFGYFFFSSVRILNVCCCLSNGILVYPLGLTPSPSNPLALQAFGEMRCNKLGCFLNFAS